MDPTFGIRFFGALFAILNPLMVLPLFLALTDRLSPSDQRRTGIAVALYTAVMCAAIALAGRQVLAFFGISIDEFRVAGGIVLSGIALSMLSGGGNPGHEGGRDEPSPVVSADNIAFYPLTFPLTVGPGTITTLLVFVQETNTPHEVLVFALVVAAMVLLLGFALYFGAAIGRRLSATLRVIISRLMGMILLAIAIGMLVVGLKALLPGLA